eukprot:PhF_6_TR13540/c0_g1_i1/m.21642
MIVAGAVAFFCVRYLKMSNVQPLSRKVFWSRIVPLGIVRSTDIGFGNFALTLVTVAFQQIIKSTIPVYVCVLSVLFLGKQVKPKVWVSLLPIVGGTVLASLGEIGAEFWGLLFALISCGGRAFKAILNARLLSDGGSDSVVLDTYTILMYEAPLSGIVIGIVSAVVEFAKTKVTPGYEKDVFFFNLFCGVLMFFNQLSYLSIIQHTSALTCQILMNLKMVILILVSVTIFSTPISAINYLGIVIATLGCTYYAKLTATPTPPAPVAPNQN